jgi:hypothetical protein
MAFYHRHAVVDGLNFESILHAKVAQCPRNLCWASFGDDLFFSEFGALAYL